MPPPDPPPGATGPTDPTPDAANGKSPEDAPAAPPSRRDPESRSRRRTGIRASGDLSPKTFAKLSEHLASLDKKAGSGDAKPAVAGAIGDREARSSQEAPALGGWFEPAETPAGGGRFAARAARTDTGAPPPSPAPIDWGTEVGTDGGRAGGPGRSGGSGSGRGYGSSRSLRSGRSRRRYRASRKRLFKRRSRGRRILIWSLIGLGALLIVGGVIIGDAYYQASKVYGKLKQVPGLVTEARTHLQKGQLPPPGVLDLANGNANGALDTIANAGFAWRLTRSLPLLGRPIQAVELASQAAAKETDAAVLVDGMIKQILGPSGGTGAATSPVFHNGVIDVGLIQRITPTLETVVKDLHDGDAAIKAIPSVPFFHQVEDLKAQVLTESRQAVALSERALDSFRLLPGFLGADGPKTYYLALQNPADQRGTGGAVLAYAILRIDHGAISIDHAQAGTIYNIDSDKKGFPVALPKATEWYLHATGVLRRLANGANYSPDFPAAALAWTDMLQSGSTPIAPKIDGVIAMDPFSVEAAFAGEAITLPELNLSLPSSEIPKFVMHDQYLLDRAQQRVVPGLLIRSAFEAITNPPHLFGLLQSMSGALSEKHIQVWSADPELQAFVAKLGWDGALANPAGGDYLALAYEKRIGNKVDYYAEERVNYDVTVNASGGITSTYDLGLGLPVPQGEPPSVVGRTEPYGVDLAMFNLYVPKAAHGLSHAPTGDFPPDVIQPSRLSDHVLPKGFVEHLEGAFRVFTNTIIATPVEPGSLRFRYSVPGVIRETPQGKVYTLTVQNQPMVRPMTLSVRLHLPKGAQIVFLGPGWTASPDGRTAFHTGPVTDDFTTSVIFK